MSVHDRCDVRDMRETNLRSSFSFFAICIAFHRIEVVRLGQVCGCSIGDEGQYTLNCASVACVLDVFMVFLVAEYFLSRV